MRKMKDSGIEWIGEIPEEWRITTIGKLFFAKAGGDAKTALYVDEKDNDHPYPVYTNAFDEKQVYAYTSLPVFPKNSITVTGRGDIGHAILRKTEFDAIIRLNVLTSKFNLCEKYFVYFIDTVTPFFTNSAAVGQLSATQITSYNICFPPLPEQQAIAAHLDRKCSEIDSVTAKTKATIEEYKKLKQAIITQVVTKGIRKGRKMKDSGVEWIGEIPEEWIISRVKYVSYFQPFCDTSHLSNDSIITYTPMENIKNGYYIDNKAPFGMVASSLTPYCEGDIVIAKVTPCFENGNISIMNNLSSGFGMGSSELFVVRPKIMLTKYLFYWLQNKQFISIACSTMTGTGGLKRVSPYFFKNSPICLPDNDEQQEIATYLDEKCSAIDTLIAKKEQLLTELESYKKSVIYEYVTGKKEVI